MKTIFTFLVISLQYMTFSQSTMKNDIILKTTGDELIGKVQEISDADIKFSYAGEALVYTIKKSDIAKITFASGRVEMINYPKPGDSKTETTKQSGIADHHNKIAILPFSYLMNKQDAGTEMTYKVQDAVFSILSEHAGYMTLQSTQTTNSLLLKAGITSDNIRSFTMGEVCDLLGVEYVIQGSIVQDLTSVTNTGGSNTYSNTQGSVVSSDKQVNKDTKISSTGVGVQQSSYTSNSSTSTQNYTTNVSMKIYTDKGETIFSEDHKSFWGTDGAYKTTLNYLLKRTPLYKK